MQIWDNLKRRLNEFVGEPVDIYRAHKYLLILGQMFGLATYKIYDTNGRTEFKNSCALSIVNVGQIFFFASLFTLCIVQVHKFEQNLFTHNERFQIYATVFSFVLSLAEIIVNTILTNRIINVYKEIADVDKQFRDLDIYISYK